MVRSDRDNYDLGETMRITAHVVERVRPGSIVLLHVMYPSRAESRRALPMIVTELRARGYRFVTVQELLARHEADTVLSGPRLHLPGAEHQPKRGATGCRQSRS